MNNLLPQYKLNKYDLEQLYLAVLDFYKNLNIPIEEKNIKKFLQEKNIPMTEHLLAETAISDGQTIYLEIKNKEDLPGRLYNLIHLGGHYFQWSAKEDTGLEYYGEKAWEIGQKDYEGSSDLRDPELYEFEAHRISMTNLLKVLEKLDISQEKKTDLLQFVNDNMNADLAYIMSIYREENYDQKHFWKINSKLIKPLFVNLEKPYSRGNLCVPVLKPKN